ncbi:hypothetical protein GOC49_04340 [Sinorhizobium meliloti]|nr:hypothetical protein [Sinorhizobium meliloti]
MSYEEAIALLHSANVAAQSAIGPVKGCGGGYCGMSAVLIRDARHPFVRHLRAARIGQAGHPGWIVSPDISGDIQNIVILEAASRAMAGVLESAGIRTHIKIWPD